MTHPNSEYPWWRGTWASGLLLGTGVVEGLFVTVAVLQRVSFYWSYPRLSGVYRVTKTTVKRAVDSGFGMLLTLLLALYITYGNVVAIWFVLGAVMNPNRFLQYASALTTLYLFVASKLH